MNASSNNTKYKRLVLAVKHGSVILGAPCGKGYYFSVRGRHLHMRMKANAGPANPCNNELIWSGLIRPLYSRCISPPSGILTHTPLSRCISPPSGKQSYKCRAKIASYIILCAMPVADAGFIKGGL